MLSIPDMALLGAAALLLFGPEQLPRVMRKAGTVMRDIQNTSQSFIREMERAADAHDVAGATASNASYGNGAASIHEPWEYGAPAGPAFDDRTDEAAGADAHGAPFGEAPDEASSGAADDAWRESVYDENVAAAPARDYEPPAPDPEPPPAPAAAVAEKLAEPRPALDFADAPTQPLDLAEAPTAAYPAVRPPTS